MVKMKNSTSLVKLVISIIICQLAGLIGAIFTSPNIPTWYASLTKPFFNPPSWVFAPVWTVLYTMIGISIYLIWQQRTSHNLANKSIMIFVLQLILNSLWSIAFFGLKSPLLGLIVIVALWIAILATILMFREISKTAANLLIPYLLWVSFATILNFSILLLN